MSADNWTICPQCGKNSEQLKAEREQAARDAYGKVSAEEYMRLVKKAQEKVHSEPTLREDYEIRTFQDGVFHVKYSCRCTACGWEFSHTHEEQAYSSH